MTFEISRMLYSSCNYAVICDIRVGVNVRAVLNNEWKMNDSTVIKLLAMIDNPAIGIP